VTSEGSALANAAHWIEAITQGPIATSLAVLAIAAVGFAMLRGRLSVRRGTTVVLGCFIMFGASSIAHGITQLAYGSAPTQFAVPARSAEVPVAQFSPPPTAQPVAVADPYAGASVAR
jgi:type IV secretory pathway VirB2 component (pilin)